MSQDRESKLQRANVYRPVVFLTAQERRQNKFVWFLGKTGFFYIFEPLKQNHLRGEKKKKPSLVDKIIATCNMWVASTHCVKIWEL